MSILTYQSEPLSPLKRALLALQDVRSKLDAAERQRSEPIAVVGVGCRFPGGVGEAATFWGLLRRGGDGIRDVPRSRWAIEAFYDPDPDRPGKMWVRGGGFLDGVEAFDAAFFGISPREAASMDPQQRLLLEVAWEALEEGGQSDR